MKSCDCDLLVRVAKRQESEDLALTLGEWVLLGPASLLRICRNELGAQRGVDVALARRDGADCRHDLGVGRLLQYVTTRPGLESRPNVPRVVLHREDEDPGLRNRLQQRGHSFDTALFGHHQIQKDDVRLAFKRLEHCAVCVWGFADRLDVGLCVEQPSQT